MPELNLLQAMDAVRERDVALVSDKMLYPLMMWFSNHYRNTPVCNYINKNFFTSKPKMLLGLLSLCVDKHQKWIKYPKADTKCKDDRLDIVKPVFKKLFGWSDRVFEMQKNLVKEDDFAVLNEYYGFTKQECKKLGINYGSFKVVKPKKEDERQMRLF